MAQRNPLEHVRLSFVSAKHAVCHIYAMRSFNICGAFAGQFGAGTPTLLNYYFRGIRPFLAHNSTGCHELGILSQIQMPQLPKGDPTTHNLVSAVATRERDQKSRHGPLGTLGLLPYSTYADQAC